MPKIAFKIEMANKIAELKTMPKASGIAFMALFYTIIFLK